MSGGLRDRWAIVSIALVAGIAIVGLGAGFVWFPRLPLAGSAGNLWDDICRAAGSTRSYASVEPPAPPVQQTSDVEVVPGMLRDASAESIGRGATFAIRCTMCHGARGLSDAKAPNLAGQYPAVIYKQLQDFKSDARISGIMTPLVADLSDADMQDLAAYYAFLPRLPAYHPVSAGAVPRIVQDGAPMRNIAPCGACHGGMANKAGSAWLEGQPEAYLLAQLKGFASGSRHNDISQQMRNVARGMTSEEIHAAATYYANTRPALP